MEDNPDVLAQQLANSITRGESEEALKIIQHLITLDAEVKLSIEPKKVNRKLNKRQEEELVNGYNFNIPVFPKNNKNIYGLPQVLLNDYEDLNRIPNLNEFQFPAQIDEGLPDLIEEDPIDKEERMKKNRENQIRVYESLLEMGIDKEKALKCANQSSTLEMAVNLAFS